MTEFISELLFIFQRFDWLGVVDLLLVTLIFFGLLYMIRDTQAMVLLRGIILLLVVVIMLISILDLPAFSWLVRTALPGLVFAIPVIFAPEIRRALERLGRAGTFSFAKHRKASQATRQSIPAVVSAAARLSARQHGALIILRRFDNLDEYTRTGVMLHSQVTPEMLMQIFFPNTPLHDGAAILDGEQILAAGCVMPLSASGILARTPEKQMGLRHRAALGISEASDAIAVVVSEETGIISIAHGGRMIRRLDADRLQNILDAFFTIDRPEQKANFFRRSFPYLFNRPDKDKEKEV